MTQVVMITGAARGLGLEAARQLYASGYAIALAGLEPEELERQAELLGDRAAAFEVDVTDADALAVTMEAVVERFGGIDVVVANAGVAAVGTVSTMPASEFERVIEVNLLGVCRTVRAALPYIKERRGYVLCISSLAAVLHLPLMSSYTAAKAGVEAFADSLRQEVLSDGVDVGVVYLSFVDTDMVRDTDQHPGAVYTREHSPSFMGRRLTVPVAGATIAGAVRQRKRRAWAPKWAGATIALRGIVQPALERMAARQGSVGEAVRLADEAARSGEDVPGARIPPRGRSKVA